MKLETETRPTVSVKIPLPCIIAAALTTFLMLPSCGTSNLGDCPTKSPLVKCSSTSVDENVRIALNKKDLTTARSLLEAAIEAEPTNYQRYPLLASVYAGLAGFDLLAIATATPSGDSINDSMDAFLPTTDGKNRTEYVALIDLMGLAVSTLQATPEDFRAESATNAYAASTVQQMGIYQAAQASMYMKLFTFNFDTGASDISAIDDLTDDDAAAIMELLASVAEGDGVFADAATATLASINAGGGTDRDNLAEFLGN